MLGTEDIFDPHGVTAYEPQSNDDTGPQARPRGIIATCVSPWWFLQLCILLGVAPGALCEILPHAVNYPPYTAAHVVAPLQLLPLSGLAFFVLLPLIKRTLGIGLEFDGFYRRFSKLVVMPVVRARAIGRKRCLAGVGYGF